MIAIWKLILVAFIYSWVTYDFILEHHYGFAIMFSGYVIGIIGSILAYKGI